MDVVELDPSMSAVADRIREPRFKTVKRGYDPSQVLEYLTRVADRVQALEGRVRELESELDGALQQRGEAPETQTHEHVDPIDVVSAQVAELMKSFDRDVGRLHQDAEVEAERIVDEARIEAERIEVSARGLREQTQTEAAGVLDEAKSEADRIRLDAHNQAEEVRTAAARMMQDARDEAERDLSGLKADREGVLTELQVMQDGLVATVSQLAAIVRSGSGPGPGTQESNDEAGSVPPHV
jgi:DivIVA domain-containing protein